MDYVLVPDSHHFQTILAVLLLVNHLLWKLQYKPETQLSPPSLLSIEVAIEH